MHTIGHDGDGRITSARWWIVLLVALSVLMSALVAGAAPPGRGAPRYERTLTTSDTTRLASYGGGELMAADPNGGYWTVSQQSAVIAHNGASALGSPQASHLTLAKPIVGMAATPNGAGYWLVASDGGIFTYGDAQFYGSTGALRLNLPIVGMAATPDGRGYWLVAADGGIFTFGDAQFYGSTGGTSAAMLGMVVDPFAAGYSLVEANGSDIQYPSTSSTDEPVNAAETAPLAGQTALSLDADASAMEAQPLPASITTSATYCYYCAAGPALAAAASASATGNMAVLASAEDQFNSMISAYVTPSGGMSTSPSGAPWDIATMFFGTDLGMALWATRGLLDPATIASWTNTLTGMADFLVANGNLGWYTNGNINIGNALLFELAYKASGESKYQADYETALAFAENPPQGRWPGFGLIITKEPTLTNGSDGAGYFAESGGGAPGFDADYTQLQLDQMVRLYMVTDDPSILRLVNLLFNQLWPLVDTTDWTLNTSGGTRHPQLNRYITFTTPELIVLALAGGRSDLVGYINSQLGYILNFYQATSVDYSPGGYDGFGYEAATICLLPLIGT